MTGENKSVLCRPCAAAQPGQRKYLSAGVPKVVYSALPLGADTVGCTQGDSLPKERRSSQQISIPRILSPTFPSPRKPPSLTPSLLTSRVCTRWLSLFPPIQSRTGSTAMVLFDPSTAVFLYEIGAWVVS